MHYACLFATVGYPLDAPAVSRRVVSSRTSSIVQLRRIGLWDHAVLRDSTSFFPSRSNVYTASNSRVAMAYVHYNWSLLIHADDTQFASVFPLTPRLQSNVGGSGCRWRVLPLGLRFDPKNLKLARLDRVAFDAIIHTNHHVYADTVDWQQGSLRA